MSLPHVLALQCAAGGWTGADPPLLAAAENSPRQVPRRVERTIGEDSGAAAGAAIATDDLGARGFGRRGAGCQRPGRGTEAAVPTSIGWLFQPQRILARIWPELASARKMSFTSRWILHLRFVLTCDGLRPELIVIAETEFWPNFLRLAHESGAQVAVVNARISDRSWPGYRRVRRLLSRILLQVDLFLTQTEEDALRLVEIGAPAGANPGERQPEV